MTQPQPKLRAAHKQVTLTITAENIAASTPISSSHCMIADAVKEALPEAKAVSVDLATIRFTDPRTQQRYVYLTPGIAQDALVRFDQGLELQPFTIRLARPVQVVRAGVVSKAPGGRKRQGVAMTENSKLPTILGGSPPPMNALSSIGKGAPKPEMPVAPYDPSTAPNVTLNTRRGHIRQYGMKQLRP